MMKKIKNYLKNRKKSKKAQKFLIDLQKRRATVLEKIECLLYFRVHGIEKVLLEKGEFKAVSNINDMINNIKYLLENNFKSNSYIIIVSLSILHKVCIDNNLKIQTSIIKEIINKYDVKIITNVGYTEILNNGIEHSVREFKKRLIDRNEILKIIEIAKQCSSSCNRQPWRIYYSKTTHTNELLKKYIPDKLCTKNIFNFIVITVNLKFFYGEISQLYINGGIFLQSLNSAIRSLGYGSCIFQATDNLNYEKNFRKEFHIDTNDIIIGFIGFGEMKDKVKILCAERKQNEDYLVCIDDLYDDIEILEKEI